MLEEIIKEEQCEDSKKESNPEPLSLPLKI